MTVQLLYASGLYGAATLAAALDAGLLPAAGRRVLLVADNSAVPEAALPLDRMPGFERLRGRFDEVRSWNEAVAPLHPAGWTPRPDDVPMWERYLRLLWGLGTGRVELVVESLQVAPALALAQVFQDAPLDVYADGLMTYGPTRVRLDPLVGERVRRVLHPDLVPGLRPLLLAEYGAEPVVVPDGAFTGVLDELAGAGELPEVPGGGGGALLLGQYLAALDILSPAEEEELHVRMVRGAVALGHRRLVFKPHPVAPPSWSRTLEREARERGAELTVLERPVLAEVVFRRARPDLVVGCFSTALFTAARFHGIPVARTGTGMLLERLTPYENGNRLPVTLADVLLPDLDAGAAGPVRAVDAEVEALVGAVGYAMRPRVRPDLRPVAERHLAGAGQAHVARYFRRRRLTSLGLPGGLAASGNRTARALARRALRRSPRLRALGRRLAS
ncbi:polysialyltransferase family glycosyltransferase [Streptomyces fradiae]|uniref:polysialyltransferase family glycosyltransferase n=1 Tax=Streptomyces fradiae TaxID=1906 RepID=UPI0033E3B140